MLLLAALLLVLYLARGRLLAAAARLLDVSEPPRAVDAVMILGGSADTRPLVAAALIRAGLARRALVPTGQSAPENEEDLVPPEHELIRGVLRARGVPDEAIVKLPGEVASTSDEARALCRFLDAEPDVTVAVVTNGYHTRRARMLFRHELGDRMARVVFFAAPAGWDADNWWRSEEGFTSYLTEYVKLLYYGLRQDPSWQAVALALAALPVVVILVRRLRRPHVVASPISRP
jgi:uncharacterized SAM-binding protein YcdF (DUF218 family)